MFTDETTEAGTENTGVDTSADTSEDEAEATQEEAAQPEQAKDWEAEAKKWEAIAKRRSKQKAPADQNLDTLVEEKVLKNMGMDDESLEYLKKVAALNGQSLTDAQKDNVFLNWKAVREQAQKVQEAQVGASKGSGSRTQQPTFNTRGLSQDQHKEMWKKAMGM